jgi:hypothetical protein
VGTEKNHGTWNLYVPFCLLLNVPAKVNLNIPIMKHLELLGTIISRDSFAFFTIYVFYKSPSSEW